MRETVQETNAREKACDFVEACLDAAWTFPKVIQVLKWAWTYIHDDRAYNARQDVQRTVQP